MLQLIMLMEGTDSINSWLNECIYRPNTVIHQHHTTLTRKRLASESMASDWLLYVFLRVLLLNNYQSLKRVHATCKLVKRHLIHPNFLGNFIIYKIVYKFSITHRWISLSQNQSLLVNIWYNSWYLIIIF